MLAQPQCQHNVPYPLTAGMRAIAIVPHTGVTVLQFKKTQLIHQHHVLGAHAPAKIGVVEECQAGPAAAFRLVSHLPDIHLHGFLYAGAINGSDGVAQVDTIHVHRRLGKAMRDLFGRDQQKLACLLEQAAKLAERFQAHLRGIDFAAGFLVAAAGDPPLHPGLAKAPKVATQDLPARGLIHPGIDPALFLGQQVVFGERQKLVPVPLVPVADHFGEIVAIAP